MALISRDMEAVFETGEAALTAKTGQSLLVKGIQTVRPITPDVKVFIEKDTVGYFTTTEPRGNHLCSYVDKTFRGYNSLSYLYDKGLFSGYPVGEGQTIRLDQTFTGLQRVMFKYDLYDAGDILPTAVNGTASNVYEAMSYGDYGGVVTAPGLYKYENSLNPAELERFPFANPVPANTNISIKALFASAVASTTATPTSGYTDRLKLVRDREVLYDQDREGFAFAGYTDGAPELSRRGSLTGWLADLTPHDPLPPYIFDEAIEFSSGEALDVYVSFRTDDTWEDILQVDTTMSFWQTVTKT